MAFSARLPLHATAMPSALINAVLFNIGWLAVVYTQSALWAPVLAAAHLALHFRLMGEGFAEARLILGVTVFGIALDHLLFALGVFTIHGVYAPPPVWLSCLWPVLGTTLLHSFRRLQLHPLLATIFGAAGGAASYIAGTSLTAVQFGSAVWGPLTMGALWALLFPALLAVARLAGTGREDTHHVA